MQVGFKPAPRTLVLAIREKECRLPAGHWLVLAINLALLNLVEEDELERAIGSKKGFHLACAQLVSRMLPPATSGSSFTIHVDSHCCH